MAYMIESAECIAETESASNLPDRVYSVTTKGKALLRGTDLPGRLKMLRK